VREDVETDRNAVIQAPNEGVESARIHTPMAAR
jgi:hypothetical protein